MTPAKFADRLNHEYEALHTAKEDAFWVAYMGLGGDPDEARADLDRKEKKLMAFLQDPARLAVVREHLLDADGETVTILQGWERTLSANTIDSEEGRALAAEIVDAEGALARARNSMKLGYQVDGGEFVEGSSVRLGTMLLSEKEEATRRAAWEGLRSIETFVLENGYVELVRMRNRLGRMMGAEDYYDWRVKAAEGVSKRRIFEILDRLEERTRDAAAGSLEELAARRGKGALKPWNLRYCTTGDVAAELDPYYPFEKSFERWGRSFAALGIDYNGAEMVLDLLDRKGKHENGFMHGPVPAWRDRGTYRPARIHFTANAIPGMVGSGQRATQTFFHEGGHAAHFANIDMPSPCFAQEFAPTSVAFAEVQSMFLDSLLNDADWQTRYARTRDGDPMPPELIEKTIRATQPYKAHELRAMCTIPYCERAIYEIPDEELSAERIEEVIRETEQRVLGLERAARPALSVPHLISGEASAYYHGYVMALVGVAQTRAFFLERDGHLVDNQKIGPDLRRVYWKPGNSKDFFRFIEDLVGEPVSADALALRVNQTVDEALANARGRVERLKEIPEFIGPVSLGARIRVVHGTETVAEYDTDFAAASATFSDWL